MRLSLRLILLGVGVFVALSNTAAGFSETVSRQSQKPSTTNSPPAKPPQPKASPSPADAAKPTADAAKPNSTVVPPKAVSEKAPANAQAAQTSTAAPAATPKPTASPTPSASPAPTVSPSPVTSPGGGMSTPSPSPQPTPIPDVPNSSQPIGPAKVGAPPQYLNVDPNPLNFPTKPEEVRLRGVQPITLQQAVELAERNSRNLEVQRLQVERSQAALREQQAALFPTVTTQVGVTRSKSASNQLQQLATERANAGQPTFLQRPANQDATSSGLNGTVGLSYDVFTSGRRPAQIRAAEEQVRSDQLQLEAVREQLRLDVTNDYYDLQEADEAVRINTAAVRNNQISLRDTQALERAGLGTRFDVLRAQVQLANSQQELTNSRGQQEIRRRQLAARLNLPFGIDLAAADPVQIAGKWNLSLENSLVLAFKNRAELEQQLVQRQLSEQQRKAALAALGPNITLSYEYQFLKSFDNDLGFGDGYLLSAGLRWDLFDGGAAVSRARQAEVNKSIAETRFADLRDQIRFQVEQAYSSLLSSFENIDTTTLALNQARESLRLARLRFQAGVGTQTDVINAETDLTRAEGNRVTAILGYNRALASLQRAITNLPATVISAPPSTPVPTGSPVVPDVVAPSVPTPAPPAPRTP